MASVYRKTYITTDKKTGRTVRRKSTKWWMKYRDASGVIQRKPGYADKTASLQRAIELEREAELERDGYIDAYKRHRKRPLSEHLADFELFLQGKGSSKKHVSQVVYRARSSTTAGSSSLQISRPPKSRNSSPTCVEKAVQPRRATSICRPSSSS